MAKFFISYGDSRFKVSLDRILRQAKRSGRFDRIIGYTPKDLPESVKASPLFAFPQGGGYRCWKPYIISHALSQCSVGDIVFYADAGCSLVEDSPEWDYFGELLKTHSAIYFQYRKNYPYKDWDRYCKGNPADMTAIKHWMKPSLVDYFKKYDTPELFDYDSLMGGFIIIKKTEHTSIVLDQWLRITLLCPELVIPPFGNELVNLPDKYYDHRCIQGILSPLVYIYGETDNAIVIPETSESRIGTPAVLATRWRQEKLALIPYIKYRLFELLHRR